MPETPLALVYIAFATAIASILLGFIALLTQKVYSDAKTQTPIEVEVPILGRMKGNYPALVFVFLGFALAFFILTKPLPAAGKRPMEWSITGSFRDPTINDWDRRGQMSLHPSITSMNVDPNGRFTINMPIEEGKTFEDVVERLTFIYPDRQTVEIHPRDEYATFGKPGSKLVHQTTTTREYECITLKPLGGGQ